MVGPGSHVERGPMAVLCADPAEAVGDTLVGGPVSPAGGMGWDLQGAGWGPFMLCLSFLIRRGGD